LVNRIDPLFNRKSQETMKTTRSDSSESAVKAMLNAAQDTPAPPAHCRLREGDLPFWAGIVRARALDEWTEADFVVGVQLARCQADIEREQVDLDVEGSILVNAKGTQIMNPRVAVLEQLSRREMAVMRCLRMGGVPAGRPEDEVGKRKVERTSRKLRAELEDDELLAT
jgi:hypothetical protein